MRFPKNFSRIFCPSEVLKPGEDQAAKVMSDDFCAMKPGTA